MDSELKVTLSHGAPTDSQLKATSPHGVPNDPMPQEATVMDSGLKVTSMRAYGLEAEGDLLADSS